MGNCRLFRYKYFSFSGSLTLARRVWEMLRVFFFFFFLHLLILTTWVSFHSYSFSFLYATTKNKSFIASQNTLMSLCWFKSMLIHLLLLPPELLWWCNHFQTWIICYLIKLAENSLIHHLAVWLAAIWAADLHPGPNKWWFIQSYSKEHDQVLLHCLLICMIKSIENQANSHV